MLVHVVWDTHLSESTLILAFLTFMYDSEKLYTSRYICNHYIPTKTYTYSKHRLEYTYGLWINGTPFFPPTASCHTPNIAACYTGPRLMFFSLGRKVLITLSGWSDLHLIVNSCIWTSSFKVFIIINRWSQYKPGRTDFRSC